MNAESIIAKDVYRGLSEEELKKLSLEEFAKLCKSRARRAIMRAIKGINLEYAQLIEKVRKLKEKNHPKLKKGIKTHCREAVIIPEWLGLKFLVYNGRNGNQWR